MIKYRLLFMKKQSKNKIHPYLYCRTNPYVYRILGLLGLVSTLIMAYGFSRFFNLSIWYWVIFSPIAGIFIFKKVIRFGIQIFYPGFDVQKHKKFIKKFWKENDEPSVDVFLPWAGEDLGIFKNTLEAVKKIEYDNLTVYIMDDKGSKELEKLSSKYGFKFLSRPNKGEFRKAGNLQYAYDRSDGEFVLILDADFVPHSKILKYTIPYIVKDPKIGILQTPQFFEQTDAMHKRNPLEFGAGNVVEDFYKVDMPSRDKFKGAMCVGTSAIYRKEAIVKAGGTPKVEGTEDVRQGLKISRVGYYVKYIPLILSIGKTPEDYQSYFRQHNRWCSGSLSAMAGKYFRKAKLSPLVRLIFLSNASYYLSEALSIIFSFHLLALLMFHHDTLALKNFVWFLPHFLLTRFVIPKTRVNKIKLGTRLAALNNIFTYFYSVPRTPFNGMLKWHPAGAKMSKIDKNYDFSINLGLAVVLIYIVSFILIILTKPFILANYNAYPVLIWASYTVIWYSIFLFKVTKYIKDQRKIEIVSFKENNGVFKMSLQNMRNYLIPVAGVFLFFAIGFNGNTELRNPESQTAIAVNTILDRGRTYIASITDKDDVGEIVSTSDDDSTDSSVLGASSDLLYYRYTALEGDDLTVAVGKCIEAFEINNDLELSQSEKLFIEQNLIQNVNFDAISRGDVIQFEQSRIMELYEMALS